MATMILVVHGSTDSNLLLQKQQIRRSSSGSQLFYLWLIVLECCIAISLGSSWRPSDTSKYNPKDWDKDWDPPPSFATSQQEEEEDDDESQQNEYGEENEFSRPWQDSSWEQRPRQSKRGYYNDDERDRREFPRTRYEEERRAHFSRPPPPPPPPSEILAQSAPPITTSEAEKWVPIDYAFPSKELVNDRSNDGKKSGGMFRSGGRWWGGSNKNAGSTKKGAAEDTTSSAGRKIGNDRNDESRSSGRTPPLTEEETRENSLQKYASARRDPVARYMAQSFQHRLVIYFWSYCLGGVMGGYLGQSFLGRAQEMALLVSIVFVMTSAWMRNPYGDWTRAAGLACWRTLRQAKRIRTQYPTARHWKAILGMGQRHPFPPLPPDNLEMDDVLGRRLRPVENPWLYRAQSPQDPEFEMWTALASMVFIGSLVGGTIPLIPSWMGALVGAASLAVLTTHRDARGDLCRTAGMRIRQTARVAWIIVLEDLQMPTLTAQVTRRILNRILILDRQHKLQDKLMNASSWIFKMIQMAIRQARGEKLPEDDSPDRPTGREKGRRERLEDDDKEEDDRFKPRPREEEGRRPPRGERDRPRFPPEQEDGQRFADPRNENRRPTSDTRRRSDRPEENWR